MPVNNLYLVCNLKLTLSFIRLCRLRFIGSHHIVVTAKGKHYTQYTQSGVFPRKITVETRLEKHDRLSPIIIIIIIIFVCFTIYFIYTHLTLQQTNTMHYQKIQFNFLQQKKKSPNLIKLWNNIDLNKSHLVHPILNVAFVPASFKQPTCQKNICVHLVKSQSTQISSIYSNVSSKTVSK